MKKSFGFLLALALVGLIAFKVGVLYLGYTEIRHIKDVFAKDAAINSGWIFSSLNGEVGTQNVKVTHFVPSYHVQAESVTWASSSAISLPTDLLGLLEDRLPSEGRLQINGLRLPIQSLSTTDSTAERTPSLMNVVLRRYQCATNSGSAEPFIRSLGISEVQGDLVLSYQHRGDSLFVQVVWSSTELGELNAEMELQGSIWNLQTLTESETLPKLRTVKVSYNDGGFFRRISYFCGKLSGLSREQYAQAASPHWVKGLTDVGIHLEAGWSRLYEHFIRDGGLVNWHMQFASPQPLETIFDVKRLSDWWPNQTSDWHYNGSPVVQAGIAVMPEPYQYYISPPIVSEPVKVVPQETPDVTVRVPSFEPVDVEQAEAYLGYRAQILLANGKLIDGRLASVRTYFVDLTRTMEGGSVSYPIDKREIEWLKVLMSERGTDTP